MKDCEKHINKTSTRLANYSVSRLAGEPVSQLAGEPVSRLAGEPVSQVPVVQLPSSPAILLPRYPVFLLSCLLLLLTACAQQGNQSLTGGPKDETPPTLVKASPEIFSTNFSATKVEIVFDEYIDLKNLNQKLVISPPMEKKPVIKKKGRSVLIEFESELAPDRTYAINFGDALTDWNEGNPLENFQYVFSTGDKLDSLKIAGLVINALTNEPVEKAVVMLYAEDRDSLPYLELPIYLSITNKEGSFEINNMAEGSYKIFAVVDGNNNFLFDQPKEQIAFLDSLITPFVNFTPASDSTDSIQTPERIDYGPLNIELSTFVEVIPKQFITSTGRPSKERIDLTFNMPLDSVYLDLFYSEKQDEAWLLEWGFNRDSLSIWITDTTLSVRDSLVFAIGFMGLDSLEQALWQLDTVKFSYRKPAKPVDIKGNPFKITANLGRSKELGVPVNIELPVPYQSVDTTFIALNRVRDSFKFAEPIILVPQYFDSIKHPRKLRMDQVFLPDSSYRLTFLPGSFVGFAGQTNDTTEFAFKVKAEDQYGQIILNLEGLDQSAVLQLETDKGKLIRKLDIDSSGQYNFPRLKPGKYRFTMILDENKNGKWDPGRYLKHIQPEKVLIFAKIIDLKAKWDQEETWSLTGE